MIQIRGFTHLSASMPMKNGPNIIPIVYTSLIPVDTIALEHTIPNYKHKYTLIKCIKTNLDFPNT